MLFSRSSLDLNKIRFQQAKNIDEAAADDHDKIMRPHIDAFDKADKTWRKLKYAGGDKDDMWGARAAMSSKLENLSKHARSIGRQPGEFITPRPGEQHTWHQGRVGSAHESSGRSYDRETAGKQQHTHEFSSPNEANGFAQSIKKHYGAQYEVEVRGWDNGKGHRVHVRRHTKSPSFKAEHPG